MYTGAYVEKPFQTEQLKQTEAAASILKYFSDVHKEKYRQNDCLYTRQHQLIGYGHAKYNSVT
jgi:hypothetical protein